MPNDGDSQTSKSEHSSKDSKILGVTGLFLVALATGLALADKASVAAVFAVLGGGCLVALPFLDRIEGTVEMGPVKVTLRAAAITAINDASVESLKAALPLLQEQDLKVAIVQAPATFDGSRLVDERLRFIRQKLQLSVIAIRTEGETRWQGGGKISEQVLHPGNELLVAGVPALVDYFAALAAADDPELWAQVNPLEL